MAPTNVPMANAPIAPRFTRTVNLMLTLSMCPRFGHRAPEIDARHSGTARYQPWLATVFRLPSPDSVPESQTKCHDSWSMVNKTFVLHY
jgi:hypothetical protein